MRLPATITFRVDLVTSLLATAVLALTLAWPEWLEGIFSVDPDQGSGAAEWGITVGAALIAVSAAILARREWRRAASQLADPPA